MQVPYKVVSYKIKSVYLAKSVLSMEPETPTLGGRRDSCSLRLHLWGQGARIALHAELFPFLLSSEGAFSGIVDSLFQENFSVGKPIRTIKAVVQAGFSELFLKF